MASDLNLRLPKRSPLEIRTFYQQNRSNKEWSCANSQQAFKKELLLYVALPSCLDLAMSFKFESKEAEKYNPEGALLSIFKF